MKSKRNISKTKVEVTTPSSSEVVKYLEEWDSLENYVLQESSLRKLFTNTYPFNVEMDDVLIKVCALDNFYSTNIYVPFVMAKHIVSLNIDNRLHDDDYGLVNEIARVQVNGNYKNLYSFATKYCSHHKPKVYPIYDSYVEQMLLCLKAKDKFANFLPEDLKQYPLYRNILIEFQHYYHLEKFDLKEIDKYLWQVGKKCFPKKYNKTK